MPALTDTGIGVLCPGETLCDVCGTPIHLHGATVEAFRVSAREDDAHGWILLRSPHGGLRVVEGVVCLRPAGA